MRKRRVIVRCGINKRPPVYNLTEIYSDRDHLIVHLGKPILTTLLRTNCLLTVAAVKGATVYDGSVLLHEIVNLLATLTYFRKLLKGS